MITLRSLPPGAMGPAPHRSPHRHDVDQPERRRLRRGVARLARSAAARIRPVRTEAIVDPALAPSTLAD